jgi:DNA modification methylase
MIIEKKVRCVYDSMAAVDDLKPHPKNRNKHTDDQIERLAKLLAYQGIRAPVVISKLSGFIVKGHGTLSAIKKNGWAEAPVVHQEFDDETQEYAFLQSDNAIANWAELDFSGINADMGDLGPDFDIQLLGLKNFTIDRADPQAPEDHVPSGGISRTRHGDVYQLGPHRLMCGDATSIDSVNGLMGGQTAKLVLTDPPYGINKSISGKKSDRFDVIANDDNFLGEWVNLLPAVSTGWVLIWTTWRALERWLQITTPLGELTSMIVWDKGAASFGDPEDSFLTDYDLGMVFNRSSKIKGKRGGSVWSLGKNQGADYMHPTQKPVALAQMAIESMSEVDDAVLDLFGGSGSTLIACQKTGRRCFMMELSPAYCDVIVNRFEAYTGQKAELVS